MTTLNAQIRAKLETFWDLRALPTGPGASSIVDALVAPVESIIAVEVLLEIDAIVGKKVPSSVIQAGGYMTREEFVDKLSASVLTYLAGKS
jgi:hypothetical protein